MHSNSALLPRDAITKWLRLLLRLGGGTARLALVLPIVAGAVLVGQAWILAGILHGGIVAGAPLDAQMPALALLAGLIALRVGLGVVAEMLAVSAGEATKQLLRGAIVGDLFGRAPVWTAARASGGLAGLAVEQIEALDGYLVRYMPAMVQAAILPVAFAIVIVPIDWVVGLLFLVTAPLIPVFMALAGLGAEAASRAQASAMARLSGRFADRLRGLVTLKLFGRAEAEIANIRAASEELRGRTMRVMRIAFISSAVLEFFAALGVAGVALYVGLTFLGLVTLRGTELTLEAGLFCLLMAPEIYQPLRLLAAHYHDRAAAKAAVAEIAATLGQMPEMSGAEPRVAGPMVAHVAMALELRAEGLRVNSPSGRPVVAPCDFEVKAGGSVAILGPSGGGKSTLIEALARLRAFEGRIIVGDDDVSAIPEARLRTEMAFLGQRPRIFAGTIADNIRLGQPEARAITVRDAARRACVALFTDALPLGLETPIGEHGLGLSGGEIQRIALARIYLRDPGLVILDEPTAHLDATTEAAVLDGLIEFAAHRTLIVATHSIGVAARMEVIWRIDGGVIADSRSTEARLAKGAAGAKRGMA